MRHVARLGVSSSKALGRAFRGGASGSRPFMAARNQRRRIDSYDDALVEFHKIFKRLDPNSEHFAALLLDDRNRKLKHRVLASGGAGLITVTPRMVFSFALRYKAHVIFVAHNHPSGRRVPSSFDRASYRALARLGAPLEIKVYQCIVPTDARARKRDADWDQSSIAALLEMWKQNMPSGQISKLLKRSRVSVTKKASELAIQLKGQKIYK